MNEPTKISLDEWLDDFCKWPILQESDREILEHIRDVLFEKRCDDNGLCQYCGQEQVHRPGARGVAGKYCSGCCADMQEQAKEDR